MIPANTPPTIAPAFDFLAAPTSSAPALLLALSATPVGEDDDCDSNVVTVMVLSEVEEVELTVLLVELAEEEVEEEEEEEAEVDEEIEPELVDEPGTAEESVGNAPVALESGEVFRTNMKSRNSGSAEASLFVMISVCAPSDMTGDWKNSWLY